LSLKSKAVRVLNRTIRPLGVSVVRNAPAPVTDGQRLRKLIDRLGITLVLDVGANDGHSGKQLRSLDYAGRIVSFEPVPSAFARLEEAAKGDPAWEIRQSAVGDLEGQIEINASDVDQTSSILPVQSLSGQIAPGSTRVKPISVPITRVDRVLAEFAKPDDRVFLKTDTQGYDVHVLRGAGDAIARVSLIRTEVIAIPLYAGQPAIHDVVAFASDAGFDFAGLIDCEFDPGSAKLLWGDAMFINRAMTPAVTWKWETGKG